MVLAALAVWPLRAADRLDWNRDQGIASAEIQKLPLTNFLERLAAVTGWQIYVEPETEHTVSAKFKEQPVGEALRRLFGNLSFALLPQSGAPPKLLVFRTSMEEATQLIAARKEAAGGASRIKDELIVTLKPGQSIDELARVLGAKVIGSSKGLNAYRLKFEDVQAAANARELLKGNAAVAGVDYNYLISRPGDWDALGIGASPPLNLKAKPIGDGNPIVVGLVDTAIQPLGKELDAFILKSISVAGEATLPKDQLTHGTAMAETILKGLAQLLPEGQASTVRIISVDVYGPNSQTTTYDVGVGTYEAIKAGANIINYSLGGDGESTFLREVIAQAREKGIIPIAAAGNEAGTAPTYPAAYPEVLAITAGDKRGQIAPWANNGSFVDAVAPGSAVVPYGNQSYIVTGTSTATAYASGFAAALADKTGKSSAEVEKLLLNLIGVKKP